MGAAPAVAAATHDRPPVRGASAGVAVCPNADGGASVAGADAAEVIRGAAGGAGVRGAAVARDGGETGAAGSWRAKPSSGARAGETVTVTRYGRHVRPP